LQVNGKEVPNNYEDLISNFPYSGLPPRYVEMGRARFEGGLADKYQREWEGGTINQAFIPDNDTLRELEEEVVDALFNVCVYMWKHGSSSNSRNLCIGVLRLCQDMDKIRRLEEQELKLG
jgi:hypothetical protein